MVLLNLRRSVSHGLPFLFIDMKNTLLLIIIALALSACCNTKNLPVKIETRDSIITKVVKETKYVKDTVYLEIPAQTAERTTQDSTSHLENDYATSDARINEDGTLYHDLKTKQQSIPVEVDIPVQTTDSTTAEIKYKDREVKIEVPRELTWWQKTKMYSFWALLALFVISNCKGILSIIRKII